MRTTLLIAATLAACAPPAADMGPAVEAVSQTIRNGTREPQLVMLEEGQVLALGWLHPLGEPGGNFCTGTIIAPRFVATARHCVEGRRGARLGFGVGLLPRDPTATFPVEAVYAHPAVDAAILRLAVDATERLPELIPIAFNRAAPWEGLVGSEVEAGGYGETYDRSREGRYFAVVLLEEMGDPFLRVNGRGEQGICFGDSGGPVLTVNPEGEVVVLGVESSGDASCVDVDRLTRLDLIADWIDARLAGEEPPDRCEGVDYLGECAGSVARWCENGRIREENCDRRGQVCDFVNDEVGFWCTEAPPCGEIDSRGICDGDTVVRCRFGRLTYDDCSQRDRVCGTDRSGAFCAVDRPLDMEVEDAGVADAAPEPDAAVEEVDAGAPEPDAEVIPDSTGGNEQNRASGDGCRAAPGAGGAGGWALFALGLLAVRRRR